VEAAVEMAQIEAQASAERSGDGVGMSAKKIRSALSRRSGGDRAHRFRHRSTARRTISSKSARVGSADCSAARARRAPSRRRARPGPERAPARAIPRRGLAVHQADALRFDFSALPAPLRVVATCPNNISTPLLFHLADAATRLQGSPFHAAARGRRADDRESG